MSKLKAIFAWFFFLLIFNISPAQQYDKVWILGVPMASMTFENDTIINDTLPNNSLESFLTIADICDSIGNLLFYTNGIQVYNIEGNVMINGDSLSSASEYYDLVDVQGMPGRQNTIILPKPGDTNLYYIFHYSPVDTQFASTEYEALYLYYSIVDMRQDSGRGAIIAKNIPIISDQLLSFSRLAACRHANGRDWWIVKNAWSTNIYYEFLLTPDGVQGPFIQQIGPDYGTSDDQPAYSSFSPDGTKYASVAGESDLVVMDFDRCTGLFANPDSFYNNQYNYNSQGSVSGGVSLAFSPSGRFIYIDLPQQINQYDLSPSRTADSIRIFTDSSTEFYQMDIIQLAPNGKMYISCWDGGSYKIHVINQPDSLGAACDFQFLSQPVLSLNPQAIPYFPNFRLGALLGSPCDTLTDIQAIVAAHPSFAQITPNPASDRAVLVYYTGSNTADQALMYDVTGREVWRADVMGSAGNINMNLSSFPAGIYIVKFTADGNTIMNTKLVIARY